MYVRQSVVSFSNSTTKYHLFCSMHYHVHIRLIRLKYYFRLSPWRDGDYAGVVVDATKSPNQIHWYHNDTKVYTTDLNFEITSETYPTVGMFREGFEVEINFVGPFIMDKDINSSGNQCHRWHVINPGLTIHI